MDTEDARVQQRVAQSEKFYEQISDIMTGVDVPGDERSLCATILLHLTIDHCRATTVLCKAEIYGTAFALMRISFDTYVRGVWLRRCATAEQLDNYVADNHKRKFEDLIKDVETHPDFSTKMLSDTFKAVWKQMNSFTHGGLNQILRRRTATDIRPTYPADEIIGVIGQAEATCVSALVEMAGIADRTDVAQRAFALVSEGG